LSNSGIVEFEWDGVAYALRFTFDAIDSIERKFGAEWMDRLTGLFNGRSVADLAFVGALAAGMTQKQIKAYSPPVVPFVNALYAAWELAWHGQETSLMEAEGSDEKKLLTYVRALMKRVTPGSD
jgi:hypothetical protein